MIAIKELISVATVEELIAEGKKVCYKTPNTLITPAAQDLLIENQINVVEATPATTKVDPTVPDDELAVCLQKLVTEPALLKQLIQLLKQSTFQPKVTKNGGQIVTLHDVEVTPKNSQTIYDHLFDALKVELQVLEIGTHKQCSTANELHVILSGTAKILGDDSTIKLSNGDLFVATANTSETIQVIEPLKRLVLRLTV